MKKTKKLVKIKSSDAGSIGFIKENKGIKNIAIDFRKKLLRHFPKEKDDHFFSHTYTYQTQTFVGLFDFYTDLFSYLDISPQVSKDLDYRKHILANPDSNRLKKNFNLHFNRTLNYLTRTDLSLYKKLKKLNKIECIRLSESMRCIDHNCPLASVVMAVSAVEYRLHRLIEKKNKKLYNQNFKNATLGGIIKLFKQDDYKEKKFAHLKSLLPEKHKPLMFMLNNYRIFSAHPKEEVISHQTAKTILSFSFLLLLDNKLECFVE